MFTQLCTNWRTAAKKKPRAQGRPEARTPSTLNAGMPLAALQVRQEQLVSRTSHKRRPAKGQRKKQIRSPPPLALRRLISTAATIQTAKPRLRILSSRTAHLRSLPLAHVPGFGRLVNQLMRSSPWPSDQSSGGKVPKRHGPGKTSVPAAGWCTRRGQPCPQRSCASPTSGALRASTFVLLYALRQFS